MAVVPGKALNYRSPLVTDWLLEGTACPQVRQVQAVLPATSIRMLAAGGARPRVGGPGCYLPAGQFNGKPVTNHGRN